MSMTATSASGELREGGPRRFVETERVMAELLANRYGDGVVYIESDQQRQLFRRAVAQGFVTSNGFVTLKGRGLLARTRKEQTNRTIGR